MRHPEERDERDAVTVRLPSPRSVGAPAIAELDSDDAGVLVRYEGRVYRPTGPSNLSDPLVAHVTPVDDHAAEVRVPGFPTETWHRSAVRGSRS